MEKEDICNYFKASNRAPYLFVGSGFTKHYFGTPDWREILQKVSPKLVEEYTSTYNIDDYPTIAQYIAKDATEQFWMLPDTDEYKQKYKHKVVRQDSILKIKIAELLEGLLKDYVFPTKYTHEISLLKNIAIDGIITTNWDKTIECIFPQYNIHIGQKEMLKSGLSGIGEIFKIHGCISEPDTIVLTKNDYDDFNTRNTYLAAKLTTILVEHPVVFIGYSLNDPNIQSLLSAIIDCLDMQSIQSFQEKIFFVNWNSSPSAELSINPGGIPLTSGKILPATIITTHEYLPVYECISNFERKITTSELRKYQDLFYNITLSQNPEKHIYALQGNPDEINKDVQFVFGFGAIKMAQLSERGYKGLQAMDIYKDILRDTNNFDANRVLTEVVPMLKVILPLYKYLNALNIHNDSQFARSRYKQIPLKRLPDLQSYSCYNVPDTISEIINDDKMPIWKKAALIPKIAVNDGDLDIIKAFLVDNLETSLNSTSISSSYKTHIRKLVCFYDLLKYGWN